MKFKQLTKESVNFPCGKGHIYQGFYNDGNTAILIGREGLIEKLSVNLEGLPIPDSIENNNQFYVRLYGSGYTLNEPAFQTGLFKKVGEPFQFQYGTYEKWELIC